MPATLSAVRPADSDLALGTTTRRPKSVLEDRGVRPHLRDFAFQGVVRVDARSSADPQRILPRTGTHVVIQLDPRGMRRREHVYRLLYEGVADALRLAV